MEKEDESRKYGLQKTYVNQNNQNNAVNWNWNFDFQHNLVLQKRTVPKKCSSRVEETYFCKKKKNYLQ